MRRLPARLLVGFVVVVALWTESTSPAFATFRKTVAGSTSVTAHTLQTAPVLSCTIGTLTVNLTWTAVASASQPDVYGSGFRAAYEVLRSPTLNGSYSQVYLGPLLAFTQAVLVGNYYYKVRMAKHLWVGPMSNVKHADMVALAILSSCT